jgi:Mg2+ and Co2+ transporter CorA
MLSVIAILSVITFHMNAIMEAWTVNFDLFMNTHQNLIVFIVGLGLVLSIVIEVMAQQKEKQF